MSNSVLKHLRQRAGPYPKNRDKTEFYEVEFENPLIKQQNELLHNTLQKAVKVAEELPVPDLDLNFDL